MKKPASLAKKIFLGVIYLLLFIVFCAVAVGIIYYASGYRFDAKTGTIQKTGLLVVNNWQNDGRLKIDGKEQQVKTGNLPNFIPSSGSVVLLPGKYDIEIARDNYIPYKETIDIQPELITKIDPIIFIPEKLTKNEIYREKAISYSISPDKNTILVLLPGNQIAFVSLTNQEKSLFQLPVPPDTIINQIVWSHDNRTIAMIANANTSKGKEVFIFPKDDPTKIQAIKNEFSFFPDIISLYFSKRSSDTLFAIANAGSREHIYRLDLNSYQATLIDQDISWTNAQDDALFYFIDSTKTYKKLPLDSDIGVVLAENSSYPPSSVFIHSFNNKNTWFQVGGTLVDNLDHNTANTIDTDVIKLAYQPKYGRIYYLKEGSFEFYHYDLDKKEKKLLTTAPGLMRDLQPLGNSSYLLYRGDNNTLNIIKNNGTNQTTFFSFDNLLGFFIRSNEEIITISKNANEVIIESVNITKN